MGNYIYQDVHAVYRYDVEPPSDHLSGLEETSDTPLEDVADHVFETDIEKNPGLAAAWLRLVDVGNLREVFVEAYQKYLREPGPLLREQPEIFSFMKEHIFMGRDYLAEWSFSRLHDQVESLAGESEGISKAWTETDFESRVRFLNEAERRIAEAHERPVVNIVIETMPESVNGYYDGTIHINGRPRVFDDFGRCMAALFHAERHAYQANALETPGLHWNDSEMASWQREFGDGYLDPRDYGLEDYSAMESERDARIYEQLMANGLCQTLGIPFVTAGF
jgi:hypothetical protein